LKLSGILVDDGLSRDLFASNLFASIRFDYSDDWGAWVMSFLRARKKIRKNSGIGSVYPDNRMIIRVVARFGF